MNLEINLGAACLNLYAEFFSLGNFSFRGFITKSSTEVGSSDDSIGNSIHEDGLEFFLSLNFLFGKICHCTVF